ncbi:hypothetical protein F0562_006463 [Nyssa sinensis]|uniref:UDP-glycosyltransferases domain-containing protein n=1 Tax=Nyssa sinensis TaxID=561372 RepID=A0A5J5AM64_9ASTE|nr:hypothetical protein F0562_006463 [Nyssa sinensis]
MAYCHVLDKGVKGQYVDQKGPLRLPGCKAVRPKDLVDPMLDRNDQMYHEFMRMGVELTLSDGVLINTWEDLERTLIEALRENEILQSVIKVPIYPIGPSRRSYEVAGSRIELLEWLDMQPSESVIYVSFGSGRTLSAEQITELAWGLELSQQRFVWVVHPPIKGSVDGFFSRQGTVLMAPRTTCPTESITNGLPMVTWPLYVEQKMNATMLTEELGGAVRNDQMYHEFVRMGVELTLSDGVLINTWEDLERTSIEALRENEILWSVIKVPVYPIGPLWRSYEVAGSRIELLEWLDMQPSESVIYVSFGSGEKLLAEQITELAWGLELS